MSMFQYWSATVYEAGIFPLKYFWSRGRKGQGVGWPGLLDAVVKNMKVSESSSKDLCQVLTAGLHNGDLELNWFLLRQKPQFFILVLTMEDLFYILMSGLKTKLEHWKYFELVTGEKRRHKYESFMCSIMMLSRGRAPPCAPPGDRHFWNILFFGSLFLQYGAENMHMTSDLYTAERYTMKANIIMRELSTQLTMFQILKARVIKEKSMIFKVSPTFIL